MKTLEEIKEHFPNIDLNEKYHDIFKIIESDDCYLNIVGSAGTGKSTLIKILNYALSDYNVVTCATTGVASALLSESGISCTTLHSTFNLGAQDVFGTVILKKPSEKTLRIIDNLDYLIIDEVSMLSCDTFDYLITLIHNCRLDNSIPKIILLGDVGQLPPVVKSDDKRITDYYNNTYGGKHYYFNAKYFSKLNFKTIIFDKVYRQDKDVKFKEILNRIRIGEPTDEDLMNLNSRVIDECEWEADHEDSIRIVTTNKDVQKFNDMYLDVLNSPLITLRAKIEGLFRDSQEYKSGLYPEFVNVKKGARVMITRNDVNEPKMFVNGDIGTLKEIHLNDEKPYVTVELTDDNGNNFDVYVQESTTFLYDYNIQKMDDKIKIQPNVKGSYTNIPIKIAYASTVHKNQGKTIKKGMFDKGWWLAENAVYVALSRFRKLEDLALAKPLKKSDIKVNKEALEFLHNHNYF